MKRPDQRVDLESDGARASAIVLVALLGAIASFGYGVASKESCSSAVGSVDVSGGGLALPCDLVGVVTVTAVIGLAGLLIAGLSLGAHRSMRGTVVVVAAMGAVIASCLVGLTAVPLG